MSVLRLPAWWICAVLLVLHQFVQYGMDYSISWADNYLDPLLCMPFLLGLILQERKYLYGVQRLTCLETVVIVLALSLVFEEGFPRWKAAFVRDEVDYLCYAIGGGWFWWQINPSE